MKRWFQIGFVVILFNCSCKSILSSVETDQSHTLFVVWLDSLISVDAKNVVYKINVLNVYEPKKSIEQVLYVVNNIKEKNGEAQLDGINYCTEYSKYALTKKNANFPKGDIKKLNRCYKQGQLVIAMTSFPKIDSSNALNCTFISGYTSKISAALYSKYRKSPCSPFSK